ncbi:hypothetical protein SLS58_010782 [Diplodia intermedia]|uniref:Solute carrier family 40 member n=1 Tax=Diplodia intermedia TaxID=856260 RepID=A0ABR3T3T7_9PEZI
MAVDHHSPAGTTPDGAVRKRLYASHFLSTWNARVFEFGAVLYLASVYPGTLLPMSVYALSRQAAAAVLAPAVGRYIDGGDRLDVVRLSIEDDGGRFLRAVLAAGDGVVVE